ncbi:unnamed protein product [Sphagnum tenellum]
MGPGGMALAGHLPLRRRALLWLFGQKRPLERPQNHRTLRFGNLHRRSQRQKFHFRSDDRQIMAQRMPSKSGRAHLADAQ